MSLTDGGPAFPEPERVNADGVPLTLEHGYRNPGMSLRDYFAGQAMVYLGSLAIAHQNQWGQDWDECPIGELATDAYRIADAMLEAREAK